MLTYDLQVKKKMLNEQENIKRLIALNMVFDDYLYIFLRLINTIIF